MSDSQFRLDRHVSCSQLSLAAFSSGRAVGHGQRHCGRAHSVEVQVRDPGGPHVLVGLLVGDEVNGSLADRVPQHGVPGGPGQRDVVDGVEPRLRPEGVPVALHHVRQGQDVGVEVAVVELAEGLPPHDVGGVDGQPVVLCAHRLPRQHAVVPVLLPHRGHLPRLGAAEVLEGHGQLAQDAVPRLLQLAVRPPLLDERPSLRRRARRRAQLQLGVKPISGKSSGSCLCVQALRSSIMLARLVGKTFMLSTNLSLICRHFLPEVAVVALLDRGLQGAPAGEGFWRGLGLGLGLWRSLGHGHGPLGLASFCLALGALVVAVLPSSSRGALLTGEPIVAM